MSFGERLRREREMRGVSLDDIAEATKIGTRLLRALEEENFELLPGGIFNKGFVRAYAKYLGMNEDEAVADYLQAAGESGPDPRVIAEQNAARFDRTNEPNVANSFGVAGFPLIPVLVLLVVVAAGWGGWRIYQDRLSHRQAKVETPAEASGVPTARTEPVANDSNQAPQTIPIPEDKNLGAAGPAATEVKNPPAESSRTPDVKPPVADNAVSTVGEAPGPEAKPNTTTPDTNAAGSTDSSKPATAAKINSQTAQATNKAPTGQPFEVAVRAKDRAWVSIKSDGKFVVRGIINPSDVKTVQATDQVVFYTGNAGAVEVSFNGQRIALPAGANSEGVLVFNSRGLVIPNPAVPVREP